MNRNAWFKSSAFALALTALLLAGNAFGQGGNGELAGRVSDQSGAVVAGAEIFLVNSSTGEKRNTVTTQEGTYRFVDLPVVGSYTLQVSMKGFKSVEVANVDITVGAIATRDVTLEVGTSTEVVTVEAGAQMVQTEDSSLSGLLDQTVWLNMPLETRSQNEFINLLPGAEPAMIAQLGTDRGAAVNGARSGAGNFLVEGFDNNDQGLGGGGSSVGPGGANTTIDPDAIQEYRVIEHIPPAEYGKAGGFVTDTVLKSGTNSWHGSLFEYNRNQSLAANSFFSNRADLQDHLVRNQYGGTIGGPILKDKAFFFFSADGHRERSSSPLTAPTFTSQFYNFVKSGAFETFMESDPNGICMQQLLAPCPVGTFQSSTTGPVFNLLQSKQNMPLCNAGSASCPNSTVSNVGEGAYTSGILYPVPVYGTITVNQPQTLNQARYIGKVDLNLRTNDRVSGSYLYDNADSDTAFAGGDNPLGPSLPNHTRAQNAGVTWSHNFGPSILNQARMSYVRHTGNFPGDPSLSGYPSVFTAFDSPAIAFGNSSNLPQFFTENEFVWKDDLSVTKGRHSFKGGAEFRRTRNGSSFQAISNGLFGMDDVEDLLTDGVFTDALEKYFAGGPVIGGFYEAEASINPTNNQRPDFYRGYRANEVAMYIQDDWRASNRLTLNLGVRWEYFGPPHNFQPNIDANFYPGVPTTPAQCILSGGTGPCNDVALGGNPFFPANNPLYASIATGTVQVRNHDIWNKDLNNFGPRLGFAWDALGNQKMVVRGGYGISYDRMYNNIFENIRFNPPYFAFSANGYFVDGVPEGGAISPGLYTAPFTSTAQFGGAALTPSLRAMDPNLVTAYYEAAHFGIQYQLTKDTVLETNYVGTFGHKLMGIVGENTYDGRYAPGFPSLRVNPNYSNISFRTNCCNSNYNALQVTLRKRMSNGLQLNANYTYSKALDDISDAFSTKNASASAYPTDSMNMAFDYGPADFDVRHRGVVSMVYDLPVAKGNRWIGGWSISSIVSVQTGTPFSVTDSGVDSNHDGQFNDRASWLGGGSITHAIDHNVSPADGYLTQTGWAMPNTNAPVGLLQALPCPASINQGLWCEGASVFQMRRNSLNGPGYFNTDFGIEKAFKITEGTKLTLEGNFFNIFNHPNFLLPDNNLANDTAGGGSFGQSTATFVPGPGGARVVQLALRLDF